MTTTFKNQHIQHVRTQVRDELLNMRTSFASARFIEISSEDDSFEFQASLGRIMDSAGLTLGAGEEAAMSVASGTPIIDDLLQWLDYQDFRALTQETYGDPGYFPATVLANKQSPRKDGFITYVFDLDALALITT